MKNLFFVPFAFDKNKATGANVNKKDPLNTYLKSICVALISARLSTPDMDVALVCNMELPTMYKDLLLRNGILIFTEPFDSFLFADSYPWCLAYYKLCALEKMVQNHDYDNYIYTDADVFVQGSLENIFEELKDNILLYDINHGLGVPNYVTTDKQFRAFGIDQYITQYGGEFFGASRPNAQAFLLQCKAIYDKMVATNFITTKGDEFILSIAASKLKSNVRNAGAYIFRFWTGDFYLVSTCYQYNAVSILHLPDEKNAGILKLFSLFVKNGRFPKQETVHRLCHLSRKRFKTRVRHFLKKFMS